MIKGLSEGKLFKLFAVLDGSWRLSRLGKLFGSDSLKILCEVEADMGRDIKSLFQREFFFQINLVVFEPL